MDRSAEGHSKRAEVVGALAGFVEVAGFILLLYGQDGLAFAVMSAGIILYVVAFRIARRDGVS